MNTAQNVRLAKERNPASYCPVKHCLWRIKDKDGTPTPCRKHAVAPVPKSVSSKQNGAPETKPSITERIARFRCERVMSHVVEDMHQASEVWACIDLKAGPDAPPEHVVVVRNDEAVCQQHPDASCGAPISVQGNRMALVLGGAD